MIVNPSHFIVSFAIFSSLFASAGASAAIVEVWLAAGQSNMTGSARDIFASDQPVRVSYPDILFAQDTGLVPAEGILASETGGGFLQPRLNANGRSRARFGPEIGFGEQISLRSQKQAIVKFSRNGTSLNNHWRPGGALRNSFFSFADQAIADIAMLGFQPRVAGVIWVQGEGDANSEAVAGRYRRNLENFSGQIRTHFGSPDLPFLLNIAHADLDRPFTSTLRAQQTSFIEADPNAYGVSGDDLTIPDDVHFDTDSHLALGRRLGALANAVAVPEPSLAVALLGFCVAGLSSRRRSNPNTKDATYGGTDGPDSSMYRDGFIH